MRTLPILALAGLMLPAAAIAAPPTTPVLLNGAVYGGVSNQFVVTTTPGARAVLYASARGPGRSCPSLISPACLDIKRAIELGSGVADGNGDFVVNVVAPSGFPGDGVYFQAGAAIGGSGVLSDVVVLPYYDTCVAPTGIAATPGVGGIAVDGTVTITFDSPVAEFQEILLDGTPVEFTPTDDSASFSLDGLVDYDSSYTLTVTNPCGASSTLPLSTEDEPVVLTFGESLVGRAYLLDVSAASFTNTQLNGLAADLITGLQDTVVIGAVGFDVPTSALSFAIGSATGTSPNVTQDECSVTTAFPGVTLGGDRSVTTQISIPEYADLFDVASFSGTFSEDGTSLGSTTVTASVIAVAAAEAAGITGLGEGIICILLPSIIGESCSPCPVQTGIQCITATITGATASQLPDPFVEISADDVLANPICVP